MADVRVTGASVGVTSFFTGTDAFECREVSLPQVTYPTNAATPVVHAMRGETGNPLLLRAPYGKGLLHVLAIPDAPADLYRLPREVLAEVRRVLGAGMPVRLEGAGRVALFVYDNGVCLVQSFLLHPTRVELVWAGAGATAVDVRSGEAVEAYTAGVETRVPLQLWPGTYAAVRVVSPA